MWSARCPETGTAGAGGGSGKPTGGNTGRAPRVDLTADQWCARFKDLGDAGHVNIDSGHGAWPEGNDLLRWWRSKGRQLAAKR